MNAAFLTQATRLVCARLGAWRAAGNKRRAENKAQRAVDRHWPQVPALAPHLTSLAAELAWRKSARMKKVRKLEMSAWRPHFAAFVNQRAWPFVGRWRLRCWMRRTPGGRAWSGKGHQLLLRAIDLSDQAAVDYLAPHCDLSLEIEVVRGKHPRDLWCSDRQPNDPLERWSVLDWAVGKACPSVVKILTPRTPLPLVERALRRVVILHADDRASRLAGFRSVGYMGSLEDRSSALAEVAGILAAAVGDHGLGVEAALHDALSRQDDPLLLALCARWPNHVCAHLIDRAVGEFDERDRLGWSLRMLLEHSTQATREEVLRWRVDAERGFASARGLSVNRPATRVALNVFGEFEMSVASLEGALAAFGEQDLPVLVWALARAKAQKRTRWAP